MPENTLKDAAEDDLVRDEVIRLMGVQANNSAATPHFTPKLIGAMMVNAHRMGLECDAVPFLNNLTAAISAAVEIMDQDRERHAAAKAASGSFSNQTH